MRLFKKKISVKEKITNYGQGFIRKYTSEKYGYFTNEIINLFNSYMKLIEIDDELPQEKLFQLTHEYIGDAIYKELSRKEYVSQGIMMTKIEAMYAVWHECIKWRYKKGLIEEDDYNKSIASTKKLIEYLF